MNDGFPLPASGSQLGSGRMAKSSTKFTDDDRKIVEDSPDQKIARAESWQLEAGS
jgi:hypothetical protein